MMSNLFSIFDTNTNMMFEFNWMSSLLNILTLPLIYWNANSRIIKIFKIMNYLIYKEIKSIFTNNFNLTNTIFFIALLMFIFFNNFMGLFPYIFTSSSHLIFSLSVSLPMWLSLMFFGWLNNPNFMFSHMIPQGTPNLLMPFMVLIETISNIIRPGTLAIRLTANMIAGHLLLTLLSQSSMTPYLFLTILIIMIQIILLILEFSVSVIQSYVFTILSSLYTKETN